MKSLKVKDLILLLKKVDQYAKVTLEGCDCADDCVGISNGEDAYKGSLVLRRNGGVFDFDDLEIIRKTNK
jgi:hypothetical protein